jgi:hypothetical protein
MHGALDVYVYRIDHIIVHHLAGRWQSIKPRGGPSGNPAVVMAQLEDAARQLQDVQEEAEQLCKVRAAPFAACLTEPVYICYKKISWC